MAKEPRSLAGKVVAITGGARGIGRATAEAFLRKGAIVSIGDLDLELAGKTAAELGGGTIALPLNVTDRSSFADFLAQTEERLGPLDILVNNAGIMPIGHFLEEDDATARRMVDINLHGVIFGMKLALPGMLKRRSGHIVNIASQAGKAGFPGVATYCATKHAVVGLTEAARGEYWQTGVDFSCVMPSIVRTELTDGIESARGVKDLTPEEVASEIVTAVELNRYDVNVPRWAGGLQKTMTVLPRRWREGIARAMKADKVILDADPAARAGYEDRAAHSEPGLAPEEVAAEELAK